MSTQQSFGHPDMSGMNQKICVLHIFSLASVICVVNAVQVSITVPSTT